MWTFGGILSFMLVVQIISGITLAMHYVPNDKMAFDSVEAIRRDVNYGWLLRNMHAVGASMFFLAVYLHIARGLYYGSYKAPREILWILGVIIFLLMMATGFMGYTLPWGQMSFWGVTVITNLVLGDPYCRGVGGEMALGRVCGFGCDAESLLLAALSAAVCSWLVLLRCMFGRCITLVRTTQPGLKSRPSRTACRWDRLR